MPGNTTIVFVHGLWMTGIETFVIQRHLQAQTGWQTANFNYASVRDSLEHVVNRLTHFIDLQPPGPVHLIAHSLGGVVIHELAHTIGLTRPGRAVLICSPIQGSQAAARVARLPLGKRALGSTVCETLLQPTPRIWRAETEAGVLAGTRSLGLGRVFGGLGRPNDGTVSLSETELPGAKDSLAMNVSHTSVLFSPSAASQAAFFLSHGRFRKSP